MGAIESFREMQNKYFDLMTIFYRGEITKKERMELNFLGEELEPFYSFLSKVAERYNPYWDRKTH